MSPDAPVLTGLATAFPKGFTQDEVWDGFFAAHYRDHRAARLVFQRSGVSSRHSVVNPMDENISRWSTGERMRRYLAEAVPLGRTVARLDPAEVGLFAVASCTGYGTPGVDIRLAGELGLPSDVRRLLIGHMGCYAALPGLSAVADYVTAQRRPAVLLCTELTSLHLQADGEDRFHLVSHALFSDGAAAVVVRPPEAGARGYRVLDTVAVTDPDSADQMTWDVTDAGFRMGLSPRVPEVLARYVGDLVGRLLARHGLTPSDVEGWAVHPGGPRILDVVERELGLPPEALEPSRRTLREHGNCSSGTVLMVLDEVRAGGAGGHAVALAFGPGLTLYATLLRATP
jgi:alkylresorcinol/alkylpyrone synthase